MPFSAPLVVRTQLAGKLFSQTDASILALMACALAIGRPAL